MELPIVGFLLAMMAGSMNAWTLTNSSTFSTVQSGSVVSMGYWLVDGNWAKFAFPAISVLAFGLGSAVCGVLMTSYLRRGRNFTNAVLTSMTVLLIVLGILALTIVGTNPHDTANVLDFGKDHDMTAQWIAVAISFVAGAQGNAFHKNHGMLYGNVAVTFVVQMAFNFLVQSFFSKAVLLLQEGHQRRTESEVVGDLLPHSARIRRRRCDRLLARQVRHQRGVRLPARGDRARSARGVADPPAAERGSEPGRHLRLTLVTHRPRQSRTGEPVRDCRLRDEVAGATAPHPSGAEPLRLRAAESACQPTISDSPSALTLTGTVSPSRTVPASSALASWSPIACWTSRRSGRAP